MASLTDKKYISDQLKETTRVLFLYWKPCDTIREANDKYCETCKRYTKAPDCTECPFRIAAEHFSKFAKFIGMETHKKVCDAADEIEKDNEKKGKSQ